MRQGFSVSIGNPIGHQIAARYRSSIVQTSWMTPVETAGVGRLPGPLFSRISQQKLKNLRGPEQLGLLSPTPDSDGTINPANQARRQGRHRPLTNRRSEIDHGVREVKAARGKTTATLQSRSSLRQASRHPGNAQHSGRRLRSSGRIHRATQHSPAWLAEGARECGPEFRESAAAGGVRARFGPERFLAYSR